MSKLIERIKVITTSVVTFLTLVAAAAPLVAAQVATALPERAETITAIGATVVVWLGVTISIIRIVTTVSKSQRGILLPESTPAQAKIAADAINYLARNDYTVADLEAALLKIKAPAA